MNKFKVIAGEVYKKNVKSAGFISMVLSPIIILAIVGLVIYFVGSSFDEVPKIALITTDSEISTALESNKEQFDVNKKIKTKEAAEKAMKNEQLDGYLVIKTENNRIDAQYVHTSVAKTIDMMSLEVLLTNTQLNRIALKLDLTQEEVMQLKSSANVEDRVIHFEGICCWHSSISFYY